eukprot:GCRY01002939.1.p1 GENE.GCRY01002939.1~~GCRY01002939.1.p1  ORF type:complete len:876 (+),score=287.00 GCRY01002939.1:62-2689(+)
MKGTAIVKAVPSGDSVVILGNAVKGGLPPEKEITLSGILAPKLARRENQVEEPFAFDSREFLRKQCIGKVVTFEIEKKHNPSIKRDFGKVLIHKHDGEKEDVAILLLKQGLVKMRWAEDDEKAQAFPDFEAFLAAQKEAQEAKKGLWSEKTDAGVRNINWSDYNAKDLYESSKGKTLKGIVEWVRDGSFARIMLLPGMIYIPCFFTGIQCPGFKRSDNGEGDVAAPFAHEAKIYTEVRILHREVSVVLDGIDSFGNFYATVTLPQGNIALSLLKAGLANLVVRTAQLTADINAFRVAEKAARDKRLKIWADYVPPESDATALVKKDFVGKVVEVVSGDTMVVLKPNNAEVMVHFASLRAPRMKRDERDEDWAFEALEFLRKKCIGKKVSVQLDYSKPDSKGTERSYATFFLEKLNLGVALVEAGLVDVVKHRGAEHEFSRTYDDYLLAETKAKEKGIAKYGKKPAPAHLVNDISRDAAKAKQMLGFLQRTGRQRAVVEFVFSASRYKVRLLKDHCSIILGIAGIKSPMVNRREPAKSEPHAQESLAFARHTLMQHEVEVDIHTVDKAGCFIGEASVRGDNVAVLMLREGVAMIQGFSAERLGNVGALERAQESAQAAHRGVWVDWHDTTVTAEAEPEHTPTSAPSFKQCFVTEILPGGTSMYVQFYSEEVAAKMGSLMSELQSAYGPRPTAPFAATKGAVCVAKMGDGVWYRVRVEAIEKAKSLAHARAVDYGHLEVLPLSQLSALDAQFGLSRLPAQAHLVALTYLKSAGSEYADAASDFMSQLTDSDSLALRSDFKDSAKTIHGTLFNMDTDTNLACPLLEEGLARVAVKKGQRIPTALQPLVTVLQEAEAVARKNHRGVFEYGDPGDSEDEL